jgi:hypothetical protein
MPEDVKSVIEPTPRLPVKNVRQVADRSRGGEGAILRGSEAHST